MHLIKIICISVWILSLLKDRDLSFSVSLFLKWNGQKFVINIYTGWKIKERKVNSKKEQTKNVESRKIDVRKKKRWSKEKGKITRIFCVLEQRMCAHRYYANVMPISIDQLNLLWLFFSHSYLKRCSAPFYWVRCVFFSLHILSDRWIEVYMYVRTAQSPVNIKLFKLQIEKLFSSLANY